MKNREKLLDLLNQAMDLVDENIYQFRLLKLNKIQIIKNNFEFSETKITLQTSCKNARVKINFDGIYFAEISDESFAERVKKKIHELKTKHQEYVVEELENFICADV